MTKPILVRLPDDLISLVDEAAQADGRSRNAWIMRALEGAVTQGEPMAELIERSSLGTPGAKALRARTPEHVRDQIVAAVTGHTSDSPAGPAPVDPSTGEILGDGPPETAMDRAKTRSHSTSQKYLVRASFKGLFWVCFVEGTELTFSVREKHDIERHARRLLEGQTEGEFTVEVKA